jgi:hypothetical protein
MTGDDLGDDGIDDDDIDDIDEKTWDANVSHMSRSRAERDALS